MTVEKQLKKTKQYIMKNVTDVRDRYLLLDFCKKVEELIGFRTPKQPIDISEDRKEFRCPTCGVGFVVEEGDPGTVDSFYICEVCGQVWKELDTENWMNRFDKGDE